MPDTDEVEIKVRVTRYHIVRLRFAMLLIPVAILVTTAARHAQTTVLFVSAAGIQVVALLGFLAAIRRLGEQPLVLKDGVAFGTTGFRLNRPQVREWTIIGRVARLYARDVSYKLVISNGGELVLQALLSSQLGRATALQRRGSNRSRFTALAVAVIGAGIAALAIVYDSAALAVIGTPAAILGMATYSVFSQRIARR